MAKAKPKQSPAYHPLSHPSTNFLSTLPAHSPQPTWAQTKWSRAPSLTLRIKKDRAMIQNRLGHSNLGNLWKQVHPFSKDQKPIKMQHRGRKLMVRPSKLSSTQLKSTIAWQLIQSEKSVISAVKVPTWTFKRKSHHISIPTMHQGPLHLFRIKSSSSQKRLHCLLPFGPYTDVTIQVERELNYNITDRKCSNPLVFFYRTHSAAPECPMKL